MAITSTWLTRRLLLALFTVVCVASTNIDLYLGGFHLYDAGSLLCLPLPYLACVALRGSQRHYAVTTLTVAVIALLALLYGLVFAFHEEINPLLSAATLRGWLYFLLAPTVWIMVERGISPSLPVTLLKGAFFACIIVILYVLFTSDLQVLRRSADSSVANLVRFDAARGYRLIIPHFAIMAAVMMAALSLFTRGKSRWVNGVFLALGLLVLYLSYSRSVLLGLPVALAAFAAMSLLRSSFFRYVLIPTLAAFYIALTPVLLSRGLDEYSGDVSAMARGVSLQRANAAIEDYPLLGYGQAVLSTRSYEDVIGRGFFPSDLGTTGIIFRYGYIGLLLYTVIALAALTGSWRAWIVSRYGTRDYSMAALPIIILMMVFLSFSWAPFLGVEEGITMSAFSIGYGMSLLGGSRRGRTYAPARAVA